MDGTEYELFTLTSGEVAFSCSPANGEQYTYNARKDSSYQLLVVPEYVRKLSIVITASFDVDIQLNDPNVLITDAFGSISVGDKVCVIGTDTDCAYQTGGEWAYAVTIMNC